MAVNKKRQNKNYYLIFVIVVFVMFSVWTWKTLKTATKPADESPSSPASTPAPVAPKAPGKMPERRAAGSLASTQASKILDLNQDPQGENFVREHAQSLWQVEPESLVFERKDNGERVKLTYIQKFNGLSIFGARISLIIDGDRLTRTLNDLSNLKQIDGEFNLSAEQVESKFRDQGMKVETRAEPIFFPVMQNLRPAYRVSVTQGGKSDDILVDAVSGRIIKKIPRTHY